MSRIGRRLQWAAGSPSDSNPVLQANNIGYIGDSLTYQGGTTWVHDSLISLGWSESQVEVLGVPGRKIWQGDVTPWSSTNITDWRGSGFHPRVWVVALCTNNLDPTYHTQDTWLPDINNVLGVLQTDEPGQTIYWIGPVLRLDSSLEPYVQPMYDTLRQAAAASPMNVIVMDLDAAWHNGRDETNLWANDIHPSNAGYTLRNQLIGDFIANQAPTQTPTTGATLHYSFSEGSGTVAADDSGNSLNGTLTGGVTWGGGKVGGGVVLDSASSQYITVADNALLQTSSGTVEVWIKTTATAVQPIWVKQKAYYLGITANKLVAYDYQSATTLSSTAVVNDGNWHHVAMVYQSGVSNGTKLYVDGAPVLTTTITVIDQTNPITLGYNGVSTYYSGSLDEATFYDRALSDTQVQADYAAQNSSVGTTTVSTSSITSATATLNWTAVSGATGYLVGRDGTDSNGNGPWQTNVASGVTSLQFTSLLPGTTYTLYCEPQPGGSRETIQITTSPSVAPSGQLPVADVGTTVGVASYTVPSGALFVATNGSDSNAGTQAAPFATLTHAVAAASAGDTIVMRAGTYYEGGDTQSGSPTNGIKLTKQLTIQNYPNEAVWLDGSRAATSWTASGSYWTASYDRLYDRSPTQVRGADDNNPNAAFDWVNPSYPCAPYPDMVFMDGIQLTQVQNKTDLGPGKFWVEGAYTGADPSNAYWFQASAVWIADNPSGHTIAVSDKVISLWSIAAGTVIRGIGIRRYADSNADPAAVVLANTPNALVEHVWIEDTANDALQLTGDSNLALDNVTIRNVAIRRAGLCSISSYEVDGVVFDKVDVQYGNFNHYNYAPQGAGIKVTHTSTAVTVQNSYFANIIGKPFWTDQSCGNVTVVNTAFENNDDIIKFEVGVTKALVANCLFVNTDAVQFNNDDNAQLWNCTVVDNATMGVQWAQDSRRSTQSSQSYNTDNRQPASFYALVENQWQINTLTMNNTVITTQAAALWHLDVLDRSLPDNRTLGDFAIQMNGNVYNGRTSVASNAFTLPNGSNGTTNYTSLSAFQAATGQDASSTMVTGSAVLDNNYQLVDTSLHTNAVALPADIAGLIGQATGTKQAGAFV